VREFFVGEISSVDVYTTGWVNLGIMTYSFTLILGHSSVPT
jgi:hypothetical protein